MKNKKKFSKSLRNFVNPEEQIEQYEKTDNYVTNPVPYTISTNETSEIKKAIAYPIGDKNNAKAASILGSPYYKANYWHGFFYFEMDPSIVDTWKSNNKSQKAKAKNAIKLMDKLVQ